MKYNYPKMAEEVKRIGESNGLLDAHDVREAARSKSSPLHPFVFNKPVEDAAEEYYLERSRLLIRLTVEYLPVKGKDVKIRYYQSLHSDRYAGGGYRTITTVLSSRELRRQLLNDAITELQQFEKKYHLLKELTEVFSAIKSTRRKMAAAKSRGVKVAAAAGKKKSVTRY